MRWPVLCVLLLLVVKSSLTQASAPVDLLIPSEGVDQVDWNATIEESGFSFARAQSAFRFADLFKRNAVLQRDMAVPVWGFAPKGHVITVTYRGASASGQAKGSTGRWQVTLPKMEASSVGATLEATDTTTGATISIIGVVVGEVWLCTGQSNMARWANLLPAKMEQELMDMANTRVRLFTSNPGSSGVPRTSIGTSGWKVATAYWISRFSATCFAMGVYLQRALGLIVGLICAARNSTPLQAWMPHPSLPNAPPQQFASVPIWGYGNVANSMLAPIVPYAFRGMAWYQGENNLCDGFDYRNMLVTFFSAWRKVFGFNFPALIVQLAPNNRPSQPSNLKRQRWAVVRESQAVAAKELKQARLVCIIDAGLPGALHPPFKKVVGQRLALTARNYVYEQSYVVPSGPVYNSFEVENGKAVVGFRFKGTNMRTTDGTAPSGFTIAGSNRKFYIAQTQLQGGGRVEVWHPEVGTPAAVRYAWSDYPEVNLTDESGLPAQPFRTDAWDLPSQCAVQTDY